MLTTLVCQLTEVCQPANVGQDSLQDTGRGITLSTPLTYCMLAHGVATSPALTSLNSLIQVYEPSRSLRPANEWHLVLLSQRGRKSQTKLFSCVLPWWWSNLLNSICSVESLFVLKNHWVLSTYSPHMVSVYLLYHCLHTYLDCYFLHLYPCVLCFKWKVALSILALILSVLLLIYCGLHLTLDIRLDTGFVCCFAQKHLTNDPSIHPLYTAYVGTGYGGNRLTKEAHTSFSATSFSSSWDIWRCSQSRWDM